jgi:hypothetical protein
MGGSKNEYSGIVRLVGQFLLAKAGQFILAPRVVRRSSDVEIDWNIFRAPSLTFGGLTGGSLAWLEDKLIL